MIRARDIKESSHDDRVTQYLRRLPSSAGTYLMKSVADSNRVIFAFLSTADSTYR